MQYIELQYCLFPDFQMAPMTCLLLVPVLMILYQVHETESMPLSFSDVPAEPFAVYQQVRSATSSLTFIIPSGVNLYSHSQHFEGHLQNKH